MQRQPIAKPRRPRRRSHADNLQLALPKPGVRIRDECELDRARRRGVCEWCGVPGPVDPAHIKSRGAGGNDTADNLVSLCRRHHDEHHSGRISDEQLRELVRRRV